MSADNTIGRKEYEMRHADVLVALTRLEGKITEVRQSQLEFMSRMDERARVLELQVDRATAILNEKLETMNQFRQQINSERISYITNDKLVLVMKNFETEIDNLKTQLTKELTPLQSAQSYDKGRNAAIYAVVAVVVSVALSIIIKFLP